MRNYSGFVVNLGKIFKRVIMLKDNGEVERFMIVENMVEVVMVIID